MMLRQGLKSRTQKSGMKAPLAEGIIPLDSRGRRNWRLMNDDEIVRYAKRIVDENGISSRTGLAKKDGGLYNVLRERKLLDRVKFKVKKKETRDWASMSDDDLVAYAQKVVDEKGIRNSVGLKKEDGGLYEALRKRELLGSVKFEGGLRNWKVMSDDELVVFAQRFVDKKGIRKRRGLEKEDGGLYSTLLRRKLLDRVKLDKKREARDWSKYSADELVGYVGEFVDKKGIVNIKGLMEEDSGLYHALWKRKLVDRVEFEVKKKERRDWASMNDDELVEYAQKVVDGKRITRRSELQKEDKSLYHTLGKRKLVDRVKFERGRRNWSVMTDDELAAYAHEFVDKKGIENRCGLEKNDAGLYDVLRKRKLLDRVFADIEQTRQAEAIRQVVKGLEEFAL